MAHSERPILFEGSALPGTAIAIDHLGMYDNLPEMSEATSDWLWHFTICVGRPRSDSSENILRHVSEARKLTCQYRARLLQTVPAHFDGIFDSEVLDSWVVALQVMEEMAASRPRCTWEAPLRPGDQYYGSNRTDIAADMLSRLDKAIDRANG